MYIIYDLSNGGALEIKTAGKIYYWVFSDIKQARKFLKNAKRRKNSPEYSQIFTVEYSHFNPKVNGLYECQVQK